MPDVHVYFYETFIVIDHLLQQVSIVAMDLFQAGYTMELMQQKVDDIEQMIMSSLTYEHTQEIDVQFAPTIKKERFIEMVETAKQHIRKGDIFQVVLSQTFERISVKIL